MPAAFSARMSGTQRLIRTALQKRFYGAPAAKAPAKPVQASPVEVGQASNGIRLAAQESDYPLARVVCAVKAGSRYEDNHQRGAVHCLRVTSDNTQKDARAFGLTRELQQMGATISCTASREHLIYTLEVNRSLLSAALPYLSGMVAHQSFRPWEISDSMAKLDYELMALSEQADRRVVERVHQAAYREAGLGRSLYAPSFMISEFKPDLLQEFVNNNFTPDRMSLSAIGMSLSELQNIAGKFDIGKAGRSIEKAGKYYGGEIRESSEDLMAYSMLVGEGASSGSDEMWAFAVLEQLLGAGPQIRWSSNTTSSTLNAAVSKQTDDPFHVQAFSVNYLDSGLFGISAVSVPENSDTVIRTAAEQLQNAASKLPSKEAIQGAKNRVKSCVAFQSECATDLAQARAVELVSTGQLRDFKQTLSAIDGVSASDVQNAAKKVVGGKLSMASIGEIHNVPYIDQL